MAKACDEVVVVLGARADLVEGAIQLHGATPVICKDWSGGTWSSLRCGLSATDADAAEIVVVLGDQPTLTRERIDAVLRVPGPIVRALDAGAPSHPVVIRRGAEISPAALRDATGIELPSLPDVDTREQLLEVTERMPNAPL